MKYPKTPKRRVIRLGDAIIIRDDALRVSRKIGRVGELINGGDD